MANLYKNWGDKQRQNWNNYNRRYAKEHFKSIQLKLRYKEDKDIIDYLESQKNITLSELLRTIIRERINNEKK